jgi:hypothetical protein
MPHRQLPDAKSLRMREHWCEPMQLTVEPNILQHVAAVELETAVEIVQLDAGDPAHGRVEQPARQRFPQRVLSPLLPAGDEIVPFVELV